LSLEDSLQELARLAETAGIAVVGQMTQRLDAINPATFIGRGKVQELRLLRDELDFDMVIFDDELSPAQLRNLEQELDLRVLDRTALILDIFAMHAHTKEGALQVELAQYAYRLPRLTRMWTHLSRQGVGGVGLRGPGETQLESDRREIGDRMARLRRELKQVRQQRELRRKRRKRQGYPVVSIVGYTNAGKSTLLNCLSGAQVLVEDKLFATLDPTTRRVMLPGGRIVLFTDTVGFIQKLPTQLVAAFRATLEEVNEADLLVHVVDVSDPNMLQKVRAVDQVLEEIGAGNKSVVIALNKVDLVDPETELATSRFENPIRVLCEQALAVIPVSAQQGVGIEELLQAIEHALIQDMVPLDVTVPYHEGVLLDLVYKLGVVDDQQYGVEGIRLKGRVPLWVAGRIHDAV